MNKIVKIQKEKIIKLNEKFDYFYKNIKKLKNKDKKNFYKRLMLINIDVDNIINKLEVLLLEINKFYILAPSEKDNNKINDIIKNNEIISKFYPLILMYIINKNYL